MEDNSKKNIIIILLVVIIIILVILGILFASGLFKNAVDDDSNVDNNINNNDLQVFVKKLDEEKDYVYDADYSLPTDKDSYYGYADHDKLISANELVVPYVNIDNEDARDVNQEIYKLYEELIDTFNENLKDEIFFTIVEYESYVNNDILSIVITTESAGTSIPVYRYYTYNFDLVTGNLLDYDSFLNKLNYDQDKVMTLVENTISTSIHESCDGDDVGSNQYCTVEGMTYEMFYNNSINTYKDKVSDKSIQFYTNNNQIYIVLNPEYPVQDSGHDKLFNVISGELVK